MVLLFDKHVLFTSPLQPLFDEFDITQTQAISLPSLCFLDFGQI